MPWCGRKTGEAEIPGLESLALEPPLGAGAWLHLLSSGTAKGIGCDPPWTRVLLLCKIQRVTASISLSYH